MQNSERRLDQLLTIELERPRVSDAEVKKEIERATARGNKQLASVLRNLRDNQIRDEHVDVAAMLHDTIDERDSEIKVLLKRMADGKEAPINI